jgi:leucyl aminopeptidase
MKFHITTSNPISYATDCLIVCIYARRQLAHTAALLDTSSQYFISKTIKTKNFSGDLCQNVLFYNIPNIKAKSVLLIGCGEAAKFEAASYRKVVEKSIKLLNDAGIDNALCCLPELLTEDYLAIRYAVETASQAVYRFDVYKTVDKPPPYQLKTLGLHVTPAELAAAKRGLRDGQVIANALTYTKDLENQPANVCTPSYLAQQAKALSKKYKAVNTQILDEKHMQQLGMGGILAVSQGSDQAAKLITVEYRGAPKTDAPIALVGKGITFDSGGLSLKAAPAMDEMKYDMCGAACLLGVIKAIAELKLPLNVVATIATTENLINGSALKPGDIITTYSGQTVEVLNTDAEGRLILADAITYCQHVKPQIIIDVATLTGSIVMALGFEAAGLFSNDATLSQELLAAGEASGDRAWLMPLWEEYQEQMQSNFADMANIGHSRYAGCIIAACFLSRFIKKQRWAHLDIAGVAYKCGKEKAATGRPLLLLLQYCLNLVGRK